MVAIVELLLHLLGEPRPLHRLCGPLDRDVLLAGSTVFVELHDLAPTRARSRLVLADTSSELTLILGGLNGVTRFVARIRYALMADLAATELAVMSRAAVTVGRVGPVHGDTVARELEPQRELGNSA